MRRVRVAISAETMDLSSFVSSPRPGPAGAGGMAQIDRVHYRWLHQQQYCIFQIKPLFFSATAAMVTVQNILGPAPFPTPITATGSTLEHISVLSWNVLLPNSQDGWWTYKMYLPPLTDETKQMATWDYRRDLLKDRIAQVDADVVCLQEVSPVSFDDDFAFMEDLGYRGKEMFKKGRFRPATFWKTDRCELVAPPVHKDRTLLTAFRRVDGQGSGDTTENTSESTPAASKGKEKQRRNWYVLNCHLQAGKQAPRRLRQINEGARAVLTLARKLKERNPEQNMPLIVCGDFNGGAECGAVRYLEDGVVDETFLEEGEPVSSGAKSLPLAKPLTDAVATVTEREPPSTLVVAELISSMVVGEAFENPDLSETVVERLQKIYHRYATTEDGADRGKKVMCLADVERFLIAINGQVGRGSEFREAARQMGWKEEDAPPAAEGEKPRVALPDKGTLSIDGFVKIYDAELKQGKFWGIAHDLAVLGEPLPEVGVFHSRYDRMYCSASVQTTAVIDFLCSRPCPNDKEPSDHLPVAASFTVKET